MSSRARSHASRVVAVLLCLAPVASLIALPGCGGDDVRPLDAGVDARPIEDGSIPTEDGSVPVPRIDPALFDCRSAGATDFDLVPARVSSIPVACGLDPTCLTPQISGHRGAGGALGAIAPEDTLSAYRAAILLGIEYVETDPRPTSDGVLVNIHDTTVDRTTDGTGTVDEMTFDQVRALHIETSLPGDFSCERAPTLEEILRTARGRAIVLIDANKTDRVDLLVDAIHAADALDWSIFDTSSIDKIDQALALEPNLHIMIRPRSTDQIAPQMDHFAPIVPTIVELDIADVAIGSPIVVARHSRVMTDVFIADFNADLTGDLTGYGAALDDGAHILQGDHPEFILDMLHARGDR